MTLNAYLSLVEIKTKVASILPFALGIALAWHRYDTFRPLTLGLFFISLITLDMATTAINNYMDYKRAIKQEGYNYEIHNAMVHHSLKESHVLTVIALLLLTCVATGILLALRTDVIILLVGMLGFGVGTLYSFGPLPISRTPLGELASGVMMGGFIVFVTVYSQIYDLGFVVLSLKDWVVSLHVNLYELMAIALTCLPMIMLISNIMLANNLCDIEDDMENRRYTLPVLIGRRQGLLLYKAMILVAYLAMIAGVALGFLPITCLVTLITALPVYRHVKRFDAEQKKATTFVTAVQNFVLFSLVYTLTLALYKPLMALF